MIPLAFHSICLNQLPQGDQPQLNLNKEYSSYFSRFPSLSYLQRKEQLLKTTDNLPLPEERARSSYFNLLQLEETIRNYAAEQKLGELIKASLFFISHYGQIDRAFFWICSYQRFIKHEDSYYQDPLFFLIKDTIYHACNKGNEVQKRLLEWTHYIDNPFIKQAILAGFSQHLFNLIVGRGR